VSGAVLVHLERQVESSRRLLECVLAQAAAIRAQDVEALLARLGDVQGEMAFRVTLERERDTLLRDAADTLGASPDDLELEDVLVGVPTAEAERARSLSAELRGLLKEIGRVHDQNRVLIRQELSFVDHLMRVMSGEPQGGYSPQGWHAGNRSVTVVDARA
jgi:hypothetical protein